MVRVKVRVKVRVRARVIGLGSGLVRGGHACDGIYQLQGKAALCGRRTGDLLRGSGGGGGGSAGAALATW